MPDAGGGRQFGLKLELFTLARTSRGGVALRDTGLIIHAITPRL